MFPVLEVSAFESKEGLKSNMKLQSLMYSLPSSLKDVSLLNDSRHLIIDFSKSNHQASDWSCIDVLVILKSRGADSKSLAIVIRTKCLSNTFDPHQDYVKTLKELKQLFPKKSYNHLVLFV